MDENDDRIVIHRAGLEEMVHHSYEPHSDDEWPSMTIAVKACQSWRCVTGEKVTRAHPIDSLTIG